MLHIQHRILECLCLNVCIFVCLYICIFVCLYAWVAMGIERGSGSHRWPFEALYTRHSSRSLTSYFAGCTSTSPSFSYTFHFPPHLYPSFCIPCPSLSISISSYPSTQLNEFPAHLYTCADRNETSELVSFLFKAFKCRCLCRI